MGILVICGGDNIHLNVLSVERSKKSPGLNVFHFWWWGPTPV